MTDRLGADLERLRVHLGPSICGGCYEVGPDVHEELGCPRPPAPTAVDLRAILRKQALSGGVAADLITASAKCTRCGPTDLFSHRAGDVQRQVAFLGLLDY
jgi:copper oxidase (laccase) domain-containing protein